MNIALIGYGKMGQTIESIALERGHDVVLRISIDNLEDFTVANLRKADVAIEFTSPESAIGNIEKCMEAGIPVVCGTTGWLRHFQEVEKFCNDCNGAFLYASNFSLGVNIFFEVNKMLARLMAPHNYDVGIKEIHHTAKLDSPSGTAITLAQQIMAESFTKKQWVNHPTTHKEDLLIESERVDPAPGTHIVTYRSAVDDIEIKHTAHNRQGFGLGAVVAAEFLKDKKGIYTMQDVLSF
jgi:4-hydroxy-tetrahydrodipicolinate reductase